MFLAASENSIQKNAGVRNFDNTDRTALILYLPIHRIITYTSTYQNQDPKWNVFFIKFLTNS